MLLLNDIMLTLASGVMIGFGSFFLVETIASIRRQEWECIIDVVEELLAAVSVASLYYLVAAIAMYMIIKVDLLIMVALFLLPLSFPAALFTLAPIAYVLESIRGRVCKEQRD